MPTNFEQPGDVITVAAPSGGVTVGGGVAIGSLFGIAQTTQAVGESVALKTSGVHSLAKETGTAWAIGDVVYWDEGNSRCSVDPEDGRRIGIAIEVEASGDTTGKVRLDGLVGAGAQTGIVDSYTIALAASGTTDGMEVTITAVDAEGTTVPGVHNFEFWFSDSTAGLGLSAETLSGALTCPSVGAILSALTAKLHIIGQTAASGICTLLIVASGNPTTMYSCVRNPRTQLPIVSAASGTNWEGA